MEVSSQAVQILTEIGMASAAHGLIPPALAIFEGIGAVRPDAEGPALGMAITQISSRSYDDAAKTLREQVLTKHPNSIEAKMFLGLALKQAGRNAECDNVLKELTASGDARAQAFATALKAP